MISRLLKFFRQLNSRQKLGFFGVISLMLLASIAEVFSISMVLPLLGVLLSPEIILTNKYLLRIAPNLNNLSSNELIWAVTGSFVFAVLISCCLRISMVWSQISVSYRIGLELGDSIYRRILSQPYEYYSKTNSSHVITALSRKVDQVISEVLLPSMVVISSGMLILAIAAMLIFISPVAALSAGLGFGVIYLVIALATRLRVARYGQVITTQQTQVIKVLQEAFGGIRDIIIDGAQELYCAIYKNAEIPLKRAQANNLIIGAAPRYFIEAISIILIAICSCWVATVQGGLQGMIPLIGMLVLGAQKTLPLLQTAYVNYTQIQGGQAVLGEILELLEKPLPVKDSNLIIKFKKNISLREIWFRYDLDCDWVLRGLSLDINKGDRVGFIGETGCGKSTLLDILMGLLFPKKGVLCVDGVQVQEKNCWAWQSHIAHVPQSIYLADATVLENIAFGIPIDEIDFDRASKAAQAANISDAILSWSEGYMTVIGERGSRLSGGQRQRIGLARALYKNAQVIILDEATSALDNDMENSIMSSIDKLSVDITILMVAHRLSSLKGCNKIVRIGSGKVEHVGTYADLIGN